MNVKQFFSKKRILFIIMFAVLAFVGARINYSSIIGAKAQYFTLFQFFGPLPAAFLGPFVGILAVFISEMANFLLLGKAFSIINLLRLLPMLFAAYYFGTAFKNRLSAIVPLICMGLFIMHPIGQQVWFYSLYWLIPAFVKIFSDRLFLRSLGTTFTAHAIGSTLWLYTVPMPAEAWLLLIPIVAIERLSFAFGITFSYIGINTVLNKVESISKAIEINIDRRYVLSKSMLGIKA